MNANHAPAGARLRYSLLLSALATAMTSAYAAEPAQPAEGEKAERIEVTGSRIKRADAEEALPVYQISREDMERTGFTSIGEVLTQLTTNGAALSLNVNNGNSGGLTLVTLRNCGSNRSLVLVNGRRWVAELSGSVDLSTIPMSAVESMEVLRDGASTLYGTDAICGVINVKTKKEFDGAELRAYRGQTSEGDGERETYSMTIGASSEKGSVLVDASYTEQLPIMAGARPIAAVPTYGIPGEVSFPGPASSTTPYGNFTPTGGVTHTLDPASAGCLPNVDCRGKALSSLGIRPYDFTKDGYNYAPVNYLTQPQETKSLFVQGNYELHENVRVRSEAFFSERTSEAQLAAQPLTGGIMTVSKDSVYNPFGATAVSTFRPTKAPRSFAPTVDLWRFGAALEGEFQFAGRDFSWDAGWVYGQNNSVQLKRGFFDGNKMALALGPSKIDASTGKAVCVSSTGATIAGCVPFNIMGGQAGITPEMLAYLQVAPRNLQHADMTSYTANISGDIFDLPAGPVAIAVGLEHREESGFTEPDPLTVSGLVVGDNAATPTKGGFSLNEMYVEALIPILSGVTGAELLELNLATRSSDYSSFGTADNPKISVKWQIWSEFAMRASLSDGFRAPSISELFLGRSDSYPTTTDPCSAGSNAYKTYAHVRAACAQAGIPATYNQRTVQLKTSVGGNENLQPEEAETVTAGFVYSPDWLSGLGITVDWYNIKLRDAIGTRSASSILEKCYVQGVSFFCDFVKRDLTGAEFGNPGEISNVLAFNQNFKGGLEREGVDMNVQYRFDTSFGKFRVDWDTNYSIYAGGVDQITRGQVTADGDIAGGSGIGGVGAPRVKSKIGVTWNREDRTASVTAFYISKAVEGCAGVVNTAAALAARPGLSHLASLRNLCSEPDHKGESWRLDLANPGQTIYTSGVNAPINDLDPTWYLDATVSYQLPWSGSVMVGVQNLTDQDPPVAYSFTNSFDGTTYRNPGQYYYLSYKQSW